MTNTRWIRNLCVLLVGVVLALSLVLVAAVCGASLNEPPETERGGFIPDLPDGPIDPGNFIPGLGTGNISRDTDSPATGDDTGKYPGDDTVGEIEPGDDTDEPPIEPPETWDGSLEWPTLPPMDSDTAEYPTLPEEWDTLPPDWDTLPPEWGDLTIPEGGSLADLLAGMDGSLGQAGALAAGVASHLTVMNLYSTATDTVYLKMQSFGDYTGQGWDEAEAYEALIHGVYSADYLPGLFMNEFSPHAGYDLVVTPVMPVNVIPYYLLSDANGYIQTSDVMANAGSPDAPYAFTYRPYAAVSSATLMQAYERQYRPYVYKTYWTIDAESLAYLQKIIDKEGFSRSDPDIVEKVATYIQNAATYNLAYNRTLDRESNVVLAFLGGYREGVCRHFASAATLLYRALGIPARYTVGFMADTEAGDTVAVKGMDAHAWVEVYVDGFGWRCVEVTGSPASEMPPDGEETTSPDPSDDTTAPSDEIRPTTWTELIAGFDGQLLLTDSIPSGLLNGVTLFKVSSEANDRLLLKMRSFGNYTGRGFASAKAYTTLMDGYSADYLGGMALEQAGARPVYITVESLYGSYAIPYYISCAEGDYLIQISDTVITGTADAPYSLYYYPAMGSTPVSDSVYEMAYRNYVYATYTGLGPSVCVYLDDCIARAGLDANDPDVIRSVARYLWANMRYNEAYEDTPGIDYEAESDMVYAFLYKYQEGGSRHFAAAATLLYRALGIPARYTVGYTADTQKGETVSVKGRDAYAWVEVYVDGFGWLCVDVLELGAGGVPVLNLRPVDVCRAFNGEPLYPSSELLGFEEWAAKGYRYEASVSGAQYSCGKSSSTINAVRVYDADGRDVTDHFVINLEKGTLWVYRAVITVSGMDMSKVYDGTPLVPEASSFTCSAAEELAALGYDLVITVTGTPTDVGVTAGTFDVKILQGDRDVSYEYYVVKSYGRLEITPASLTLKAADAEKVYDGTALTASAVEIVGGTLAEGDFIADYTVEGSQTRVGRSDNVITEVIIRNADGEDVTANYTIETLNGTLRVTNP